jgi:hypothetical protein
MFQIILHGFLLNAAGQMTVDSLPATLIQLNSPEALAFCKNSSKKAVTMLPINPNKKPKTVIRLFFGLTGF